LLNNVLPPATPVPEPNQEEIDRLNQEYQDNLAKLEVYKKRLEQKKLK
jgi:hypothetical protein